jgi:hypothetical protein
VGQAELVTEKVQAGERLVRAADAHSVPLRAALWVYDGGADTWTLALEADPKAGLGPLEFSRQLHRAVEAIPDERERDAVNDLLLGEVALFTRPHPIAKMLRPKLGQSVSVSRSRLANTLVSGYVVEGALLYRLERNQRV